LQKKSMERGGGFRWAGGGGVTYPQEGGRNEVAHVNKSKEVGGKALGGGYIRREGSGGCRRATERAKYGGGKGRKKTTWI